MYPITSNYKNASGKKKKKAKSGNASYKTDMGTRSRNKHYEQKRG